MNVNLHFEDVYFSGGRVVVAMMVSDKSDGY